MDSEKNLGDLGSQNYPIRVSLKKFKGNEIIDVRKFYRDKKEELNPTRKGISLTRTTLYPLLKLLADNLDEINEFFDINEEVDFDEKIKKLELENLVLDKLDSYKLFDVENLNAGNVIKINSSHPFGAKVNDLAKKINAHDPELADDFNNLLKVLFKSYFFAKTHFEADEFYPADSLFTDHEISWSLQIKREI